MDPTIAGIHHVTAIAGDPQQNVDFYTGTLGLRLVKKTVNFDDPGTYHFYYGNEEGQPGTILTFFPWIGLARRPGAAARPWRNAPAGETAATAFSVPRGSLGFWAERLRGVGVVVEDIVDRLGARVLPFADPDGLPLELIEADDDRQPWRGVSSSESGTIPEDRAIRGFYGVTLAERDPQATAAVLTGVMGYRQTAEENGRLRFEIAAGGPGTVVDLVAVDRPHSAALGPGVTHHVAFRTPDDARQKAWIDRLFSAGLRTTPVQDREYFHSIYFREPGGVLFEIATDTPGFMVDESRDELGQRLCLPPWLEAQRGHIERILPKISVAGIGEDTHEQH